MTTGLIGIKTAICTQPIEVKCKTIKLELKLHLDCNAAKNNIASAHKT